MVMGLSPTLSMNTSKPPNIDPAFAVWLTGLPASGKSTVTAVLVEELKARGINVAVLESDVLRKILTPCPKYTDEERETFYSTMRYIGQLLVTHGVPVIFDATANRRAYRDQARAQIDRFLEVYVDSPLQVCMGRDPKGIYQRGKAEDSSQVPGLQVQYEPPDHPELVIHGEGEAPRSAALLILRELQERDYVPRD